LRRIARRFASQCPVSKIIVYANNSYDNNLISSFISACLPVVAGQAAAATEADDEAAMLAEFEANFS
jgi:hypothetical protein